MVPLVGTVKFVLCNANAQDAGDEDEHAHCSASYSLQSARAYLGLVSASIIHYEFGVFNEFAVVIVSAT